ncbi:ABC transporter permease [Skermanella mucosa]|uniref:ABC transporter permease n=1 Tax=Skermanella mucosa TaxID=1789672 RepID=UPI00192B03ED|nr:ABC transporter permease [Skermanella mucosa]UEM21867.1 ABC transporter permease [Skermanella mucosa]
MTDAAAPAAPAVHRVPARDGAALPILTVLAALLLVWYAASVWLNAPQVQERLERASPDWSVSDLVAGAWAMDRPVLPAPHQIGVELYESVLGRPVTSKRSLAFHAGVTLSATLAGFALGLATGVALAVGIVHVRVLDRSLMPWIIASQTIPILAIAPMIVVVLGNLGFTGLLPKAIISAYLSFFPIAIGMVKGLRSPDPIQLDLMRTYSATPAQTFAKLRWPSSMAFLFPSLKVAIALALVGAIVAELPTGAQAGLGARLLAGSYYGQTIQIWAALFMSAFLAMLAIGAVGLAERGLTRIRGGRL